MRVYVIDDRAIDLARFWIIERIGSAIELRGEPGSYVVCLRSEEEARQHFLGMLHVVEASKFIPNGEVKRQEH